METRLLAWVVAISKSRFLSPQAVKTPSRGKERNRDLKIASATAGISGNGDAASGWGCRDFEIAVPLAPSNRSCGVSPQPVKAPSRGEERNRDLEIATATAGISGNGDASSGLGCRDFEIAVPLAQAVKTPSRGKERNRDLEIATATAGICTLHHSFDSRAVDRLARPHEKGMSELWNGKGPAALCPPWQRGNL